MRNHRFTERQRHLYAVRERCRVLGMAPSAYYAWRQQRLQLGSVWERTACRALARYARRYGTRRLRTAWQTAGPSLAGSACRPCSQAVRPA